MTAANFATYTQLSSITQLALLVISFFVVSALILYHYQNYKNMLLHRCNEMRLIGLAIHTYIDATSKFPRDMYNHHDIFNKNPVTNSQKKSSWRFYLAPYMGHGSGYPAGNASKYFDLDKSWDEEPNISRRAREYNWVGRPKSPKDSKRYWTNVMGITGPDTAFEVQDLKQLQGCEHLIIVVEVANSGVHWGEPGDIDVNHLPENLTSGIDGNGFMVLFYDGSVWFIKKEVPMEILKRFLTITEAKEHDRNIELIPYAIVYYDAINPK